MPRDITISGRVFRVSLRESELLQAIAEAVDELQDAQDVSGGAYLAGDGTDESTAMQNAVNAASALGAALVLPPGTFYCKNVTLPANMTIVGCGVGETTVKMPACLAGVGGSIFVLSGNNITFQDLTLDGNKSNQPADGYSDSWNGGTNGTGRSYRAAIVGQSRSYVTVRDCSINNCYGAGLAVRDTSKVLFENNVCTSNNFESCYIYATNAATRNSGHVVSNNRIYSTGSGHATINGNAVLLSSSDDFVVDGNIIDTVERNGVKTENSKRFSITNNRINSVSVLNFSGIQLQSGTEDAVVSGNSINIAGGGVAVNQQSSSQTIRNITVSNNTASNCTNTDGTAGGALSVSAAFDGATNVAVNENTVYNHYKHSFQFVGLFNRLECNGNRSIGNGDTNSNGIRFAVSTGSWTSLTCVGNIFENSAGSNGQQMRFERSSTYTLDNAVIVGNVLKLQGGPATVTCTANDWISGIFAANYGVGGVLQFNQKDCLTYGNACSLNSDGALQISGQYKTVTGTTATLGKFDSLVFVNCSTLSAVTLTLTSTPHTGHRLKIKDAKGDAGTRNVTINNSGGSLVATISTNSGVVEVVYDGSTWQTL
jgi:hypothetical protein